MSVSPVILLLCYTIWVSFLVFCPALVSWISKKLRVTSPLLIFLAGRGGSHWVLVNLSFILGPRSNSIKCKWRIVGVTYKLLRGLDILIHLSITGPELISISLLYKEFYLAFVSTRLGMTFFIFRFLSSHGMMTHAFQLREIKNTSPAEPDEKVSYLHPISRSYTDSGNPSLSTNHSASRLAGDFRGTQLGFYMSYQCFCTTLATM